MALLPLSVGLLALELDLRLKADAPGLPWSPTEDISPPVLTLRCFAGLLRKSLPTGCPGSDEALSLEVEVKIAFLCTLWGVSRRMSEEPGAQA
jgi:hypothetical protein